MSVVLFQAEDGIRDRVRSRGLGDVYKRQPTGSSLMTAVGSMSNPCLAARSATILSYCLMSNFCLLYTSDAADERSSVDLGGRRIIKKKILINPISTPYATYTSMHGGMITSNQ